MEYIEHGDLSAHLKHPLPEDEARTITFQLVEGLMFLHANAFVHRDVKPKASLSTDTPLLKISDVKLTGC
jgi:calcium/calmodulin-dependent protein kinase I